MEGASEQERRAGYKWEPDWEGNPSIVAFEFESSPIFSVKKMNIFFAPFPHIFLVFYPCN